MQTRTSHEDTENWLENNIEQIRRKANSDAPDAWVFEGLLDEYQSGARGSR
jgi:hypothetical protein